MTAKWGYEGVLALHLAAVDGGHPRAALMADDCEAPVRLNAVTRLRRQFLAGGLVHDDTAASNVSTYGIGLEVRCRRCVPCRQYRARMWYVRAKRECEFAERTWFCTFTFRTPPTDELATKRLTLAVKRLRHTVPVRYLAIFERHKSGVPHIHALIHEAGVPIKHADIESQWRYGFSRIKLLDKSDARAISYCVKYLYKDAGGEAISRVRASSNYGDNPRHTMTDLPDGKPRNIADPQPQ